MYGVLRSLMFRLPPERAHALALGGLRFATALPPVRWMLRRRYCEPWSTPIEVAGLSFPNPVGLAAGYDKDALGWPALTTLGFGHIEVGTVTPRPQPGNPPPRVFRLPEDAALINRMGFPGRGAEFVAARLRRIPRPPGVVLGVNIGKNKDTPLEAAVDDYLSLLATFAPLADYLAVNVSSPNTEGLRRLQARAALEDLLGRLAAARRELEGPRPPIFVKLAPDLDEQGLDDAVGAILDSGMDGIVATNTTIAREGLRGARREEQGGLSGAPLAERSTAMIAAIHERTGGRVPIIGVGGVRTATDAKAKLDVGASLVQVYTGLIYEGPAMVRRILRGLKDDDQAR